MQISDEGPVRTAKATILRGRLGRPGKLSSAAAVFGGAVLALALGVSPAQATLYSFTGAIGSFTPTVAGDYSILAYGAQGGIGSTGIGGYGAEIGGDITSLRARHFRSS